METLSADEKKLIALVREVKQGTGFGEIIVVLRDRKIEMLKQTKTVKL